MLSGPGLQRAAQDSRGAAGAPHVHPRHHRAQEGAGDHTLPLPALQLPSAGRGGHLPPAEIRRGAGKYQAHARRGRYARAPGRRRHARRAEPARTQRSTVVLDATGAAGALNTEELLDAVAARDIAKALALFDRLWRDGMDPASVLGSLMGLMRELRCCSPSPRAARRRSFPARIPAWRSSASRAPSPARSCLRAYGRAAKRRQLPARQPLPAHDGRAGPRIALRRLPQRDSASLSARLSRVEAALSGGVEPRRPAQVDITVENPVEKCGIPRARARKRARAPRGGACLRRRASPARRRRRPALGTNRSRPRPPPRPRPQRSPRRMKRPRRSRSRRGPPRPGTGGFWSAVLGQGRRVPRALSDVPAHAGQTPTASWMATRRSCASRPGCSITASRAARTSRSCAR